MAVIVGIKLIGVRRRRTVVAQVAYTVVVSIELIGVRCRHAVVVAIGHTIIVGVGVGITTAALTGRCLERIIRTAVVTIGCAIVISVGVCYSAATGAR